MRNRLVVLGLLIAVALTACAGGDGNDKGEHGGTGKEFGSGQPGDAARASRTVNINMKDALQFEPTSVMANSGETITFRITNTGQLVHEFVLGDKEFQDEHEKEMMGMAGGMGDEPNTRTVEPGQTEDLTWTFPAKPGTVLYGCHVPGHYAGGMKGTITVA